MSKEKSSQMLSQSASARDLALKIRCTLFKTTLSVKGPPSTEKSEREPPQTEIVVKNHEKTRSENRDRRTPEVCTVFRVLSPSLSLFSSRSSKDVVPRTWTRSVGTKNRSFALELNLRLSGVAACSCRRGVCTSS